MNIFNYFFLIAFFVASIGNADKKELIPSITAEHKIDAFDEVFKPLSLDYLYNLYDSRPEHHQKLNDHFKIKKVLNPIDKAEKVIAFSLFWKPQNEVNEKTIHEIRKWKDGQSSFYDRYVKHLIESIKHYQKHEPTSAVRIYLASDLEFLIKDLSSPNVEIYLMHSSSEGGLNPGAMWRFLAISDPHAKYIYIRDTDNKVNKRREKYVNRFFMMKRLQVFFDLLLISPVKILVKPSIHPL